LITGSSNLSIAGLKNRLELNAILRGQNDYQEGKNLFDELWETSIDIVNTDMLDEFNVKVIKKIWFEKLYSPYLMYIRVLHEYFNVPTKENILTPYDITGGTFMNLKYQTDAVKLALSAIENHSGVIIADVVGLGKSIIASAIARNLMLHTIVICPPHLQQQWNEYKDQFGFSATVFSSGKIETALEHFRSIKKDNEQFLIIVDEAHNYRNEYNKDYSLLHDLCMNNKVVLLTATPFNNRPADIYSLLKLFQIPSKSTLKTVNNLADSFKELIKRYKDLNDSQRKKSITQEESTIEVDELSKQIRSIISPLTIRRSRIDLQEIPSYKEDLKIQHIEPVIPEDPIELDYDLGKIKDLYLETLEYISPSDEMIAMEEANPDFKYFKSARYMPSSYLVEDEKLKKELVKKLEDETGVEFNLLIGRQANVSGFMRKLLVSRFESSVAAFRESLNYMIRSSEQILEWVGKLKKVPIYKKGYLPDVENFYTTNDDEEIVEMEETFDKYRGRGFFEIDMKYIKDDFVNDVKSDMELLKMIRKKWFGDPIVGKDKVERYKIRFDYKLDEFKKQLTKLRNERPDCKIVVFTEYADTANYLGEKLGEGDYEVFKYTSADASAVNRHKIRANFDAGIREDMQENDYQILVATDAISEGYNLNRAGIIFNYDIPYNPTRVIQRIGRINRINKKVFEKLYIYNYFPTAVGETETRTKEISTLKMAMIHAILGEDTKALTSEEKVQAYFIERYRKELGKTEVGSWDNKYKVFLDQIKGTEVYKKALEIPHRARIGRKCEKGKHGVILFGKKGNDFVFKIGSSANEAPISLASEEAIALFEADSKEKAIAVSDNFDSIYQNVKNSLFINESGNNNDTSRLDANDKIKLWIKTKKLNVDYLKDLLELLQNDGLSGEEIRFINKLGPNDGKDLQERITQDYINRGINKINAVDAGDESLILSEEL
jgi:superfamily II DNA or RNA helicase